MTASEVGREEKGGVTATFWKLRMGNVWTVPAVELVQGEPQQTAIVVADDGRQSTAAKVAELLGAGYRVIAVDPFYLGESKIAERDYLFALLVAAVGDRPLGLQASQVAARGPLVGNAAGNRPRDTDRDRATLEHDGLDRRCVGGSGDWRRRAARIARQPERSDGTELGSRGEDRSCSASACSNRSTSSSWPRCWLRGL